MVRTRVPVQIDREVYELFRLYAETHNMTMRDAINEGLKDFADHSIPPRIEERTGIKQRVNVIRMRLAELAQDFTPENTLAVANQQLN